MRNRFLDSMIASAAVVVVSSLAPVPAAGPTSRVSFVGVAEAAGGGAQAPTAAGKAWDSPRTADGRPDLQGIWAPSVGGEVACYEGHKNEYAIGAGRAAKAAGQTGIHEHTKGFYGGK